MISRRDFLAATGSTCIALGVAPFASAFVNSEFSAGKKAMRCINIVNFIRGVEPRFQTDLLLPVQNQMELILAHKLPATWLVQFDALVSGPFVQYLKDHIAPDHEVGFWFEMNEMHCKAAGVEWRGRPGYEWDHLPPVAFTIGYTPEERIKLADTAMRQFKETWGKYPKSVASWNLDSITLAHLVEKYGVDAFAVCRDQIATDGFTIWGAPIAGYYPSKTNCWSPALDVKNQISSPVFRMLGQDPVYYYDRQYPVPGGRTISEPDTMEPVWTSGRSSVFVKEFLDMISEAPTGQFAYAQIGQENSFPWPDQEQGYPPQMVALAALRDAGKAHVETMGDSGRRFKRSFKTTPVQAQVQLKDSFGNTDPEETSIWYQSRFYRANLHFRSDLPFMRDITVYSDAHPQPFLDKATRLNDVEQKMPPVLDGYHWRPRGKGPRAGMFFVLDGETLRLDKPPVVREEGDALVVELSLQKVGLMTVTFREKRIEFVVPSRAKVTLSFEWDPAKAALRSVEPQTASYHFADLDYAVGVRGGTARPSEKGWQVITNGNPVTLTLAQQS